MTPTLILALTLSPLAMAQDSSQSPSTLGWGGMVAPSGSQPSSTSPSTQPSGGSTAVTSIPSGPVVPASTTGSGWSGMVAPAGPPPSTAAVIPPAPPTSPASLGVVNPPQNTINPAANQGNGAENAAMALNAAAAAALIAACLLAKPPQPLLCMMGMMAAMQAAQDAQAANQSAETAQASVSPVAPPGTVPAATTAAATVPAAAVAPVVPAPGTIAFREAAAASQALTDAGYAVTPNGFTSPSGTFIPNSALNSPSGMASAGFSPSEIKNAEKVLASATKGGGDGPRVSGVAVAEGAGQGSAASGDHGSDLYTPPKLGGSNPFALSAAQKQQMVAGKTILFDGDPIGVRGQDIFQMVHTAYEKRRVANFFIEDSRSPAVMLRAPASANGNRR